MIKINYSKFLRNTQPVQISCATCGFYAPPGAEDPEGQHARYHDTWTSSKHARSAPPWHYEEREAAKKAAYSVLYSKTATLDEKAEAAMLRLRAWYDRSLISAIEGGYADQHPTFEEYVASCALSDVHAEDLAAEIRKVVGPPPGPVMDTGDYWRPPVPCGYCSKLLGKEAARCAQCGNLVHRTDECLWHIDEALSAPFCTACAIKCNYDPELPIRISRALDAIPNEQLLEWMIGGGGG